MIRAEGLYKSFDKKEVLHDLSFSVKKGEIFGFLGPNGAGKTTTLRILTGQIRPDKGNAWLGGKNVQREIDSIKNLFGVVFEEQNLYERISGKENLQLFARLYGVQNSRVDEVLKLLGASEYGKKPVSKLSRGMRQRILIARALLHSPEILFLDEPTSHLDPPGRREMYLLFRKLAGLGITSFLCTHYLEEAETLCDRVAVLNRGRLVACDTPARLKEL
ncbi:MAG: ABC transporter ATP-binding protein, partial [Candidatus Eremiobacteraeota bacterium]|nr:ABC transporter ATP-binding protein [Candidatus Eremiobacteraeota bacterium]